MKSLIYKYPILKAKYEALNKYGKCVTRRLIKLPESNHEWGAPWFDKVSGKWVFVSGFGLATKSVRIKSPYQVGEIVYWREPFCKEKECDIPCYGLKDSNLNCYANRSPYSMSEKLARTFVKITSVRQERFNFNDFVGLRNTVSSNDYFLEGGTEAVKLLKEYDNLWLWRIEQEKVK